MQSLSTSKGPCPNILGTFLGDFGTLLLHVPGDLWFYMAEEWTPHVPLTKQQFIKMFHMAPPSNVPMGWWGIVPGLTDHNTCRDRNWFKGDLQAALDMFMEDHKAEYEKPDGTHWAPLSKGQFLARKRRIAALIVPAPKPVLGKRGLTTSR